MTATLPPTDDLYQRHRKLLDAARQATRALTHWSAYPEMPSEKTFGEGAKARGEEDFRAHFGKQFDITGHAAEGTVSSGVSPYGLRLDITYPTAGTTQLMNNASHAAESWADAGWQRRAGILLEALDRLKGRSFEMAHAVMHTSGQGFMMAFQAGCAHALDRALEAVAVAAELQERVPAEVVWSKPQGKNPPQELVKRYHLRPAGIGVVLGCSTFPTWNTFPGVFANLACGNPVIIKPHPRSRLPLALAVRELRLVIEEAGLNPNVVQFAPDTADAPLAQELATHPLTRLVDYTGAGKFGQWLKDNCTAHVFAEMNGNNCVLVGEFADLRGLARNLAFSLCLYAGQMCTAPRHIIVTGGPARVKEVNQALVEAVDKLLSDVGRATSILGALADPELPQRTMELAHQREILLEPRMLTHPDYPDARVMTPGLCRANPGDIALQEELFGPLAVIHTEPDFAAGLQLLGTTVDEHGGLSAAAYTDDPDEQDEFEATCVSEGVNCAINLTGATIVNHSVAFSDFHGTRGNPAATASFTDTAYISPRFSVVHSRRDKPA